MNNDSPKTKKLPQKSLLLWLSTIVLMSGGIYGAYIWQHKQLTSANNSVSQLNSEVRKLKSQVTDLQAKNKQLQPTPTPAPTPTPSPTAKPLTQADLTVSISSTTYQAHPYCQAVTATPAYAAIDMVISNPTSSAIYLTAQSLKLKDAQGNTYLAITNPNPNPSCHGGYTLLTGQSLAPGETVRGALIFQVPNSSLHNFQLINETQAYSLIIQ